MIGARGWVTDFAVGALLFTAAAAGGSATYTRLVKSGHRPFFYQAYFEPAVMVACGKGFLVAQPEVPAVRTFLQQQTDTFSCDQLPPDVHVGTEGLYQGPWRYLLTTVGLAWKLLGISWSGLGPLLGVYYAATTVLVYAMSRLLARPLASAAAAVAFMVSPLQLANLPQLRDYMKAPFSVALVLVLVALVIKERRDRAVLLYALAFGVTLGIGYGFRGDLLIDFPPFIATILLFLPGRLGSRIAVKAGAIVLAFAGFLMAAWPIVTTVAAKGACQSHIFLLGLTTPFNESLRVTGGDYSWGHLYNDEYLWAKVADHAQRTRPDLGYLEYCAPPYDVAGVDLARRIVTTFPADMVTRTYASALQVLDTPFLRVPAARYLGIVIAATFALAVSLTSIRLALFAAFVMLFWGGHPAIQFLPRHYFPFEFMTWVALAFLADRTFDVMQSPARWSPSPTAWRRSASFAVVMIVVLTVPLLALRAYQNRSVHKLLRAYSDAEISPTLAPSGPGSFGVERANATASLSAADALASIGRVRASLIEVVVNTSACRPGTTVAFRYDATHKPLDYSRTIALPNRASGPTRLFEPVYDAFSGVEVSDPSPACVERIGVVANAARFPMLISAVLPPDWESQPQYQHIVY
jgi:hypothetical protein